MYSIIKPTDEQIRKFIANQQKQAFSYPEVGTTQETLPAPYTLDHNRIKLGLGSETFVRAKRAVQGWKMFDLDWIHLYWPHTPIEVGATVAILAQTLGLWWLNACRIVYLIEENGTIEKFGFAYGTLPDHVGRGEERFCVEWHRDDDSVWYDLLAFSRPNQLPSKVAYGLMRMQQKRFAAASLQSMARAVHQQTMESVGEQRLST